MAVDDGAHAVAAGDEALPLQGGQNVPQLGAADAQLHAENALPGQTLLLGVLAGTHGGQKLGADGLGMGCVSVHSMHLDIMKIPGRSPDLRRNRSYLLYRFPGRTAIDKIDSSQKNSAPGLGWFRKKVRERERAPGFSPGAS